MKKLHSDDTWIGGLPDLSKLPKHIQEAINAPIPIQAHEIVGKLHLFKDVRGIGLNLPNARMRVLVWRGETAALPEVQAVEAKLQFDIVDSKGKTPLGSILFNKEQAVKLILQLIQTYERLTGTPGLVDELKAALAGPPDALVANKYSARAEDPDSLEEEDGE